MDIDNDRHRATVKLDGNGIRPLAILRAACRLGQWSDVWHALTILGSMHEELQHEAAEDAARLLEIQEHLRGLVTLNEGLECPGLDELVEWVEQRRQVAVERAKDDP